MTTQVATVTRGAGSFVDDWRPDWLLRFTALFGVAATLYAWAADLWEDVRSVSPALPP